jgi:site-specific DNA-methyltransferase (adenine-specific)
MGFKDLIDTVTKGDCLEVMQHIPDGSVDMILCDLPYGTTQNKWDSVIPLDKLWQHYVRIIKDTGAIVLTGQGLFTAKLILSNEKLFKYKIVWIKSKPTNFLNAKKQPLRKHEDICVFYKKQPTYNPQMTEGDPYDKGIRKDQHTGSYGDFKPRHVKSSGERYPTDILEMDVNSWEDNVLMQFPHQKKEIQLDAVNEAIYYKTAESEGKVYHPTQKPIRLGQYLIRTFTNKGDIVLDNACGSGSFLVSAVIESRRFIGIEKNEDVLLHKKTPIDYVEICNYRINQARNKYIHESLFNKYAENQ